MVARHYDIQRVTRVLFAALLVFAFVTPVCATMACSMSGMASSSTDLSHMGGAIGSMVAGGTASSIHADHSSFGDCMRGFVSHSGLIGTDALALAAILLAIAMLSLAASRTPLLAVSEGAWITPLRALSPPPPLSPLGVRLSV